MSKIHRVPAPFKTEESLENLLKQYLKKSEELEIKEERVMEQIELMQSAMSSLKEKSQKRFSQTVQEPVHHPKLREIEEETQQIKEETLRIQKEIREKIEENRKLQHEIEKRKMQERNQSNEWISDSFMKDFEKDVEKTKAESLDLETSALAENKEVDELMEDEESSNDEASGIHFFKDKLQKLKKMRKKLKEESEEESKLSKNRMDKLREKVEMLEWESEINMQLIRAMREKSKK